MWIRVYKHICMCIYIYTHTHTHTHTYTYLSIRMYTTPDAPQFAFSWVERHDSFTTPIDQSIHLVKGWFASA